MAAPDPRVVYAEQERLRAALVPHGPECGKAPIGEQPRWCIGCLYQMAYQAAHDRTVGDTVKTRGPSTSGTEVVWESKAAARASCREAFKSLRAAIVAVESIESTLNSALKHSDAGHAAVEKYPPGTTMLSAEERAATMAAAARRRERGEVGA